ncbi:2-(3-amino-3-carboxypropyl)histidine synthase KNAG_0E03800 [Huiozyma naganishii CBS 8797]|uniref:2-(3-amino-3-carboxypropyl)histidine synthase subunit 2 n=1 Tax=Huiozyma naganishii (strain ATCC MYA-139 / BCRC 22969 / CBS 8797 / KCTC 17520 / NBRC 10181 / NCYC 3082 / Yp74L-3) TaxID=1071383 RepID=J7S6W9_HUIN7|nr:hypothetical protein KNAG_0E03800 [Kazachstania naganishii CBS 8797]CCK70634.1 hypothetical protein KNAG_0E03800 [Kazachstania naganishii CBS 8797]
MSSDAVPLAVSTRQTEEEFSFQRYTGDRSRERAFYLGPSSEGPGQLERCIREYYSVDALAEWLKNVGTGYKDITLQFPNSLVLDSAIVSRQLEEAVSGQQKRRFWVLADTAYSSCCVDEVASEHVASDLVVHFGDACLNSIQRLPVVYSFGKPHLDLDVVMDKFLYTYTDKSAKICLMANSSYTFHLKSLYELLTAKGYTGLVYTDINSELVNDQVTVLDFAQSQEYNSHNKLLHTLENRHVFGSDTVEPINSDSSFQEQDYHLFHVTVPQDPHLLSLTTIFPHVSLYDVQNNEVREGPFPSLMKRYKYMQLARTSSCIGILVNTLSLRNVKETINKLTELIKLNGKKHYLFVVGKPNVAKLANFEPIDIWCILGCNQSGIIIDQINEFYKPIITPYELTLALKDEIEWTGKWVTDFQKVLGSIDEGIKEQEEEQLSGNGDDDAPEFDVVTGTYISTSRPLRELKRLNIEAPSGSEKSLTKTVAGGTVIKGTVSTSAAHLHSRTWTGLGSDFQNDEEFEEDGAVVEEGITGVARGYQFDRRDAERKNLEK